MKGIAHVILALGIGLVLVGAIALYCALFDEWDRLYALTGVVTLVGFVAAGVLAGGGRDVKRPPGLSRVHAAAVTPDWPETARAERAYQPRNERGSVVDEGQENSLLIWWPLVIAAPSAFIAVPHYLF
jgi:hypothetical protein